MLNSEIRELFRYHAPDESQRQTFEKIRAIMTDAAVRVGELTPITRERSLFITLMQQAQMMANASVALHGPRPA